MAMLRKACLSEGDSAATPPQPAISPNATHTQTHDLFSQSHPLPFHPPATPPHHPAPTTTTPPTLGELLPYPCQNVSQLWRHDCCIYR